MVVVPLAALVTVVAVLAMFYITNVNCKKRKKNLPVHAYLDQEVWDQRVFYIDPAERMYSTGSGADKVPLQVVVMFRFHCASGGS